jgi:hypothetical protein
MDKLIVGAMVVVIVLSMMQSMAQEPRKHDTTYGKLYLEITK